MLDATIFSLVPRDVYFDATGRTPDRLGNEHWDIVPNNTYRTSDGREIMIITINDKFWQVLCDAIGAPDMKTDPKFATKGARLANREAVNQRLSEIFATRPLEEWDRTLAAAGAIYGPVRTWPEVFSDPEIVANLIRTIDHPEAGQFKVVNNPLRFSETPNEIYLAPPTLGQHTEEVVGAAAVAWPDASR
jgi:formyl-CoA transferase